MCISTPYTTALHTIPTTERFHTVPLALCMFHPLHTYVYLSIPYDYPTPPPIPITIILYYFTPTTLHTIILPFLPIFSLYLSPSLSLSFSLFLS